MRRIEIENGRAVGVAYRDARRRASSSAFADGEVIVAAGALVTPQIPDAVGHRPGRSLSAHGIACLADLPGVGENLIDHPEVPMIATANGPHGYYRQGVGWRMLLNGLQFKLFGTGPITVGRASRPAPSSTRAIRTAEPTIQAFCVPIVYLDPKRRGWHRTPMA